MNELLRPFVNEAEFASQDFASGEFEVYFRLAKFFSPKKMLEVGVYKGHSACSIIYGASELNYYCGIDSQDYVKNSNLIARENIANFLNTIKKENFTFEIIDHNTQVNGVPGKLKERMFDWIHIDAGHTTEEAINDIRNFWIYTGKVMTIHDYISHKEVKDAVEFVIKNKMIDFKNHLCISSLHGFYCFFK
jgi:predicted O-methyltransferase YrrM